MSNSENIKKTCHRYYAIEPILEEYQDNESIVPATTITIKTRQKDIEVALFLKDNALTLMRISIPGCMEDKIPEEDLPIIQVIKEHMLSVLGLTYDIRTSFWDYNWWTFIEPGKPRHTGISIKQTTSGTPDPDNIRNVFVSTFRIRTQMKLMADSRNPNIPLQYRYLSLYKLLENEFKSKGKFQPSFNDLLKRFQTEFLELDLSKRPLQNYIHELRDRCAHIVTGKGHVGVTQLSNKDALSVSKFIPLMTRICAVLLNEKYPENGFTIKGELIEK